MLLFLIFNFTLPGVLTQGDYVFYYDARSLGLGGNTSVLENSNNPASIGLAEKIQIALSGFLYQGTEKRGLRVYDSYGNNIGISTVSVSQTSYLDLGPVSLILPLKFLRFGIKHYRLYDFEYYFHHIVRDYFYQIKRLIENDYTGALNALAPTIGINYKGVSLGFEINFLYGSLKKELKRIWSPGEDTIWSDTKNLTGNGIKYGIIYSPSSHIRFGYFFEPKFKVFVDIDTFNYPFSHIVGFYYQPPYRIPTKFLMELNYKIWDEPIYVYKFGIEHTILYNYSLRYGFCIYPDYNQPAIWTTNLTLGLGGQFKDYYFDIGFGLGKRDYANTDFGGLEIKEKFIFDETHNHFMLSFGFKL